MAKNTLQDLRDHLFATLESLVEDTDKPLEPHQIERAKVICQTAQTIIDTARVETKYIEVTGQGEERASKFYGPELPVTVTPRLRQ